MDPGQGSLKYRPTSDICHRKFNSNHVSPLLIRSILAMRGDGTEMIVYSIIIWQVRHSCVAFTGAPAAAYRRPAGTTHNVRISPEQR